MAHPEPTLRRPMAVKVQTGQPRRTRGRRGLTATLRAWRWHVLAIVVIAGVCILLIR